MDRRQFLALPVAGGALAATTRRRHAAAQEHASRLRVALIGHTGRGNFGHDLDGAWIARAASRDSDIVLAAVADADAAGLAAVRARIERAGLAAGDGPSGRGFAYADYRAMLTAVRPDIVVVCPRHADQHRDMLVAAIEAGARGLYVEKPFTRTLAEADEIVALAGRRAVPIVVAHRNRYHPALELLVERLAAETFGPIIEVRARGKEDQRGGGQDLCVLGGHLFNAATLITGAARACTATILVQRRPATRADSREGDEGVGRIVGDEIHACFETANGIPLFYDSTKGAGTAASGFGIQIFCRDALVDLRMDEEPHVHVREGHPFVPTRSPQPWVPFTSAGLGVPEPVADVRGLVLGHRGGIEDLLVCVRKSRAPRCGAPDARDTIEMIQAIFATLPAGGRVELPLRARTTALDG